MAKLIREDVPQFMYLINEIKKKEGYKTANAPFKHVAETASNGEDFKVTGKTVRRVFNLDINLKAGKIIEWDYTVPTMKTLNILTTYCFLKNELEWSKTTFEAIKHNKREVETYYTNNRPTIEILDIIFPEVSRKIKKLEDYKEELLSLIQELNEQSLEEFVKYWVEEGLKERYKEKGYKDLKAELIDFITYRLERAEKKRRTVSFFYRIFGSLSLFFVTTPQFEDLKSYIIDTFKEENDCDITEDDSTDEDDILDLL